MQSTMKGTKEERDTLHYGAFLDFAREYLQKHPVIGVTALEELIRRKFDHDLGPEYDEIHKGTRTVFQNLVDWVKAAMTKHREILYLEIGECRRGKRGERDETLIIYCPSIGSIAGHGPLVTRGEMLKILHEVAAKV